MILTLAGEGCFTHEEQAFRPKAGVAVLQPAGMPQRYGLGKDSPYWEHIWVGFVPPQAVLTLLGWPQAIPGVLALDFGNGKRFHALRRTLLNTHFFSHSRKTHRDLRAFNEFEGFLLDCFDVAKTPPIPLDERVTAALRLIDEEYHRDLKSGQVASRCGLSLSRIEHLIKEETGVPIHVHIENARMRHARHLLEFTRQTVSEISYAVGYHSPKQFCTRFKVIERMSPGAFRRRKGNIPPKA